MLQRAAVDVTLTGFLPKMLYGMLSAVLAVIVLNRAGVSTRRRWPPRARQA